MGTKNCMYIYIWLEVVQSSGNKTQSFYVFFIPIHPSSSLPSRKVIKKKWHPEATGKQRENNEESGFFQFEGQGEKIGFG